MTANLPLTLSVALSFFTLEGEEQLPENQRRLVDMTMVSPEYFRTVGIPFIAGRDFSERDQDAASQYAAMLFGAFGVLGSLLAVIGLYGVVSYSVSQRTHEIGVRMALGGQRSDILKLVVGEGMVLTGVGLALGLAGALVLARFISVILYGIGSADPVTFIGISVLMIVVTLEACYIPARRASGVEPTVALRYE